EDAHRRGMYGIGLSTQEHRCFRLRIGDNGKPRPDSPMAPADSELVDLIALSLVPGLGPRLTHALLDRFGSAAAARRATPAELQGIPHIGEKVAQAFANALRSADPHAELDRADGHGVVLVPRTSPEYPVNLKELADAPHLLYVRGTLSPGDG